MNLVLVSIIVIASILLVLVILAQNSKGGGLSGLAGGSSASNMIGVQKTSDLLEKVTWTLAIIVLALSMVHNVTLPQEEGDDFSDRIELPGANSLPNLNTNEDGQTLEPLPSGAGPDSTGN